MGCFSSTPEAGDVQLTSNTTKKAKPEDERSGLKIGEMPLLLWSVEDVNDLIVQSFMKQLVQLQAAGKIKSAQIDRALPHQESIVMDLADQLTLLPGESMDFGVTAEMMDAPEMDNDFMAKLAAMEKAMEAGELPPSDSDDDSADSDDSDASSKDSDDSSGGIRFDDEPAPAPPQVRGMATTPRQNQPKKMQGLSSPKAQRGVTDRSTAAISMADTTDIVSMDTEMEIAAMAAEIPNGPSPPAVLINSNPTTGRTNTGNGTVATDEMDTDEEIEALERKQNERNTLNAGPSQGGALIPHKTNTTKSAQSFITDTERASTTVPGFATRNSVEQPKEEERDLTRSRKSQRSKTNPTTNAKMPSPGGDGLPTLQKTISEVINAGGDLDDEINALAGDDVKIDAKDQLVDFDVPLPIKKAQPPAAKHGLVPGASPGRKPRKKKKKKGRTRSIKTFSIGPTAPRPPDPTKPKSTSGSPANGPSSPGPSKLDRPALSPNSHSAPSSLMLPIGSPVHRMQNTFTLDEPEEEEAPGFGELYRANETLNRVSHIFDVMNEHAQMFAGMLQRKRGLSWNPSTAPTSPQDSSFFGGRARAKSAQPPTKSSSDPVLLPVAEAPEVEVKVQEKTGGRPPASATPNLIAPTTPAGGGSTPGSAEVDTILKEAEDTDDEIERLAAGNESFKIAAHTFRQMFAPPKPKPKEKRKKRRRKRKKKVPAGPTGPTAPPASGPTTPEALPGHSNAFSAASTGSRATQRGAAISLSTKPSDVDLWGSHSLSGPGRADSGKKYDTIRSPSILREQKKRRGKESVNL